MRNAISKNKSEQYRDYCTSPSLLPIVVCDFMKPTRILAKVGVDSEGSFCDHKLSS
jgi:hypothetical protein